MNHSDRLQTILVCKEASVMSTIGPILGALRQDEDSKSHDALGGLARGYGRGLTTDIAGLLGGMATAGATKSLPVGLLGLLAGGFGGDRLGKKLFGNYGHSYGK